MSKGMPTEHTGAKTATFSLTFFLRVSSCLDFGNYCGGNGAVCQTEPLGPTWKRLNKSAAFSCIFKMPYFEAYIFSFAWRKLTLVVY